MAKITPNSPRVWLIWPNNGSLGGQKEKKKKIKGEHCIRSGVRACVWTCGSGRIDTLGGGGAVEMGQINPHTESCQNGNQYLTLFYTFLYDAASSPAFFYIFK